MHYMYAHAHFDDLELDFDDLCKVRPSLFLLIMLVNLWLMASHFLEMSAPQLMEQQRE